MNNELIILTALIFSAFFSGLEIAYLSSNKLKIELRAKQGILAARILTILIRNPSHFIGTILVGNNIALVVYGIAMAEWLNPFLSEYFSSPYVLLTVKTVIATLLVLITAEFIPKALFRINPGRILDMLAIPAFIMYLVLFPVVIFILTISRFLLKGFFNISVTESKPVIGRVDIEHYLEDYLRRSEPAKVETEIELFHNTLAFSGKIVENCLVHIADVVSVEIDDPVQSAKNKFAETDYSRIMVYEKDPAAIIGYIHSWEMFKKPESVRSILLPLPVFRETQSAKDALAVLIKERKTVAAVKNDHDEVTGIVTIEDIIEEIFGEIEDEHDTGSSRRSYSYSMTRKVPDNS